MPPRVVCNFLDEESVIGSSDDSGTANHHRAEAAVAFIGNDPQEDVGGIIGEQHLLIRRWYHIS